MNLTNEQIQAILDGAPDWQKCYCTETKQRFPYDNYRNLSDLREILALRHEVERLKVEVESVNHDIIEAVKKARTQWAREDVAAIKKRESEVAARAVDSVKDWFVDLSENHNSTTISEMCEWSAKQISVYQVREQGHE